jgi:putative Flp pilus-assembly TadE/G-like protein
MISFFRNLWRNKRGNALVIAGAALPLVIGSAGLASDTIQWVLLKRQLQRAADSAAIAGVYARVLGNDQTSAINTDLTKNQNTGYSLQSGYPQITNPTVANTTNAVKVVLSVQQPLHFSGLFISNSPAIQASATAATVQTGAYCVVSLENTSTTGITATGNSTLNLGCGMITNSTSLNAAIATGSSEVHATPVAAVGDIQSSNNWNGAELLPFTVAEADPFAGVNVPSFTGCQGGSNAFNDQVHDVTNWSADTGVHCVSSMNVQGTLMLGSATYIIDGGNFNAGSQANISCNGCTIVFTNSSSSPTATIGYIQNINATAQLNMTAPTSGNFSGILFYQDRRATSGTVNSVNGNSSSTFSGAMYFPNQQLDINGTSNLNFTCAQFVARDVSFSGNGSVNNTCTAGYGNTNIMGRHVRLVA